MKFATYQSTGFHYRSRRPTFKPQKTEEATASDENATIQAPQAVKLIPEQKPPVSFLVKLKIPVYIILLKRVSMSL